MRERTIEPEWLDALPAADQAALRSRRDLQRLNAWMLQSAIMARLLQRTMNGNRPRVIIDLGAGDGTFMLKVAERLAPVWSDVRLLMVDRNPTTNDDTRTRFLNIGWCVAPVSADVFAFLEQASPASADIIVANLFLHHLQPQALIRLFSLIARITSCFIACEPRRSAIALAASRSVGLIGCNAVTRHDAPASVRAGFRNKELSTLWPTIGWRLEERAARPFTHCFAARRYETGDHAPV